MRAAGWTLVAVLLGAAAYELTLALGAGTIGPRPGDDVAGAGWVRGAALVAMLAGAVLASRVAQRSRSSASLLAPSAGVFLVAYSFTYDPYYAPSLRRYLHGAVPLGWVLAFAALAVATGIVTRLRPREGAALTSAVLVLLGVVTLFAGDGH
jgi:dolichyl-phosphate-mannose--protein O-mannosyl transferase